MRDIPSHNIVGRIEDCLYRMHTRYQEISTLHHDALLALDAKEPPIDEILAHLEAHAFDPRTLTDEYHILKREWDTTPDIPQSDHTRITQLQDDVRILSQTLQHSYEALATHTQSHAQSIQRELNDLKRGGNTLKKYRPGGDEDRTGFDSNA